MTIPIIAFFNNNEKVGKSSLVYHLAWMYSDLGMRVVVADLDPQAKLTAIFLDEEQLEYLWQDDNRRTVYGAIQPLIKGTDEAIVGQPHLVQIDYSEDNLGLLAGDLSLANFEDNLTHEWSKCLDGNERDFHVISAFWRIMQAAATNHRADVILVDLGPNLGAINRSALIAADYVVIPLAPDLFSLQGLRNLGPTLSKWRKEWAKRLNEKPNIKLKLPAGNMKPAGYVLLQPAERLNRPVKAYQRWVARIPEVYKVDVLGEQWTDNITMSNDPHLLAALKHYHSLAPMAQEARKPIFHLKPADGALGAHFNAVKAIYKDFKALAGTIAERTDITIKE